MPSAGGTNGELHSSTTGIKLEGGTFNPNVSVQSTNSGSGGQTYYCNAFASSPESNNHSLLTTVGSYSKFREI
jgi:hypothetical protein